MKCMCPIFQKYYNALRSINELKTTNNFFDNISFVDNFFSEFRNITFVLQKQLKTPEEKALYEELRLKHLDNDEMKWFVDVRNEVLKEHSFELKKNVIVNVYGIVKEKNIINETFTVEDNDLSSVEIENKVKKELLKINTKEPELFLTIKYSFLNKDEEINIYEIIKKGLSIMHSFLNEFEEKIKNECKLCENLKKVILEKNTEFSTKRMEFITDCSYDVKNNKLVFYDKADILYGTKNNNFLMDEKRLSLKDNIFPKNNNMEEIFESFILIHTWTYISQQKHIMPTFVIVYSDMTFTLDSFFAFTKATFYRKINEISKKIKDEDVIAIMVVREFLAYSSQNSDIYNQPYEQRIQSSTNEYLSFTIIKDDIKEKSVNLDTSNVEDMSYVLSSIKKSDNCFFDITLQPIREAFIEKNEMK